MQALSQRETLEFLLTDIDEATQIDCLRRLDPGAIDAGLLAAAVEIFRARMITVGNNGRRLVDLCGTGGDHSGSFNISTTAAFVVAGAGCAVAKHGNVSITSKSGSVDMLRALGIPIPETPAAALEQLDRAGIMFLFAPYYHPAFQNFAAARLGLAAAGQRTIFNLLGPLLNPARVTRAVTGVFNPGSVRMAADAMLATGTEKALVFHGDGLDELSLTGRNIVCLIDNGIVQDHEWGPETFGLPACTLQDLEGGTPVENAGIARGILQGDISGPKKDMVILNAGAALYAAQDDMSLADAIAQARHSLESGAALAVLDRVQA